MTDCINEIIEAAGGLLDKREAAELLRKFNNASKSLSPETRAASLDVLLGEARERMIRVNEVYNIFAKQKEVQHQIKTTNAVDRMRQAKVDQGKIKGTKTLKQSFERLMYGTPGQRDGLIQHFEGVRTQFNTYLSGRLQEQNLTAHWHDAETLSNAVDVAFDSSAKVNTPEAQAIGNILREVNKFAIARGNKAGAYILNSPRYLFTSKVADAALVRKMGKDAFVDFVKGLNLDQRVFEGMDDVEITKHFERLYDRLASGGQYHAPVGTFDGVGGLTKERFADLANKNSLDVDIPFADAQSFKQFHAALATEPLNAVIARRVDQIGRSIGTMEAFGPSPDRWLEDVISTFKGEMTPEDRAFFEGGIPIKDRGKWTVLTAPADVVKSWAMDAPPQAVIDDMLGAASNPASPEMAAIGRGVRNWASMASLGYGIFSQVTDIALRIPQLVKYGDPFEAFTSPIAMFGELFPEADKKLYYTKMGLAAETMVHTLAENATGGLGASRLMDTYFKLNGMAWPDIMGKRFTANYLSRSLGHALESDGWSEITDLFRSYGFQDVDFATLKSALSEVNGIGKVVDPEKLRNLDVDLHARYLGAFNDQVNTINPTPGVRERAAAHKGLQPGTVGGEVMRTITMFKSYPSMLITRVYPNIQYEHGTQGVIATALGMIMMYYLGDSMRQMAQGKTPRDMSKPENVLHVLTASGLGGIYSDMLFHDYSANGMGLADMIGGPAVGRLGDVASLGADVITGQATPKMAAQKLNRALPNILMSRTILEHTLVHGIMEISDPGSVQRSYDQLRSRTGQERLF